MKIFDGVNVDTAAISPAWQGVVGVTMLIVNSLIEADKVRQEREGQTQAHAQPSTLGDVMQQAGLQIPGLHDALTHFMGGTDEARDAATMIVSTPDPGKLLRQFAQGFTPDFAAANGPIVTPPPTARSALPELDCTVTTRTGFRPEFTREGAAARNAAAAAAPPPPPAAFRPEFTREGAAARAAATAPPPPATFRPEFTREGAQARAATAAASPPAEPSRSPASSLAAAFARELDALGRHLEGHEVEVDSRLCCMEAEVALAREELNDLRAPKDRPLLFVVSPAGEASEADDTAPMLHVEEAQDTALESVALAEPGDVAEATGAPVMAEPDSTRHDEPIVRLEEPQAAVGRMTGTEPAAHTEDNATSVPGLAEAGPGAVSEAELARLVAMLGAFNQRVQVTHSKQLQRVGTLEGEVKVLRALVAREREARSVASHG